MLMYKDGRSKQVDSWLRGKMIRLGWSTTPPTDGPQDVRIVLPSPTLAQPASFWRGQRQRIETALPLLIRQVEASRSVPGGIMTAQVEFSGFNELGQPKYDIFMVDTIPGTNQGARNLNMQATLPGSSFETTETQVAESGLIIPELSAGSPGRFFTDDANKRWDKISGTFKGLALVFRDEKVQRTLAAWRAGTLGEAIDAESGKDEALDRITAATGLSLGTIRGYWDDLLAMSAPPGEAGEVPPTTAEQLIADMLAEMQAQGAKGAAGPRYNPPDSNLVSDWVEGQLQVLVGDIDPGRSVMLRDLYLRADRQAFDGQAVDPRQSVLERIRTFDDYQTIHRLRPDSINEAEWIPAQVGGLIKAGVRNAIIEKRAIQQATAGVAPVEAGAAANITEMMGTGRPLPAFMQNIQDVAVSTFRRIA